MTPSARQQFCTDENTVILDKLGTLIFLEGVEFTTLKNVASFYRVPEQAIKSLVFDHKDELISDGYNVMSKSDLKKFLKGTFEIPNRGLAIFPRRAVLRIGCLLRDSTVAKLVRSYLLNAEESAAVTPHDRQTLQHLVRAAGTPCGFAGVETIRKHLKPATIAGRYLQNDIPTLGIQNRPPVESTRRNNMKPVINLDELEYHSHEHGQFQGKYGVISDRIGARKLAIQMQFSANAPPFYAVLGHLDHLLL